MDHIAALITSDRAAVHILAFACGGQATFECPFRGGRASYRSAKRQPIRGFPPTVRLPGMECISRARRAHMQAEPAFLKRASNEEQYTRFSRWERRCCGVQSYKNT